MKKIISLIMFLMILSSCAINKKQEISIICPSGAPALSLIDVVDEEKVNIDIVDGSEVLQAEFINGNADIIIAPINLGVKLSSQSKNYKLAAVVTSGNLYLVSTNSNAGGGESAAFGEAAVPGKILSYLKDELIDYDFIWFNSVNEAASSFLAKEYETALLAEPFLSGVKAKSKNEIYEITNIQELYKKKTNFTFYPQAAIFVGLDNTDRIDEILEVVKSGINKYNNDKEKLKNKLEKMDLKKLGFEDSDVIVNAYSRMGLIYANAEENIETIAFFLKLFNIEINNDLLY